MERLHFLISHAWTEKEFAFEDTKILVARLNFVYVVANMHKVGYIKSRQFSKGTLPTYLF
jgi:hypothetical protein